VDESNRLVSTPAWNAAASIVEVAEGVQALAGRLVDWL
jgi:enhancing lycopene biosynthesis protein 2